LNRLEILAAQRAGIASVTLCRHAGNTNEGTHAPPSITINSTARMAPVLLAVGFMASAVRLMMRHDRTSCGAR